MVKLVNWWVVVDKQRARGTRTAQTFMQWLFDVTITNGPPPMISREKINNNNNNKQGLSSKNKNVP